LSAFMGVPVGYIIARSKRFKWMYVAGYGFLTASMFALILFNAGTSNGWCLAVALLAGLGYGVIPTINTVVVQNAVPKRLMGVAMGAIFFFLMIGSAISPAILGSTMNVSYTKALSQSLPEGFSSIVDEKTMESLDNPQILLSESAKENLMETLQSKGEDLYQETEEAILHSLEAGIRNIFMIGALLTLVSFLIICTIPRKFITDNN
jgi:MFS family permease